MIMFRTTMNRNLEVDAWDVTVEALYEPAEELFDCEAFSEAFYAQAEKTKDTHAMIIARLEGLLVRSLMAIDSEDLINEVADHCGIGGTFDITHGTHLTGESLLQLLSRGGAARQIVEDSPYEIPEDLFVSGNLYTDPFVDRGSILAYMVPHLTALTGRKLLIAHQEPVEGLNPEDQRDRLKERFNAAEGILDRIGGDVERVHLGREITGEKVRMTHNGLGEPVPEHADLPMILISATEFEHDAHFIYSDHDYEVIEFADWAEARFGIRPQPDEDFAFG